MLEKWQNRHSDLLSTLGAAWQALGATDFGLLSGVIPEQLHPHTGEPLSVSPLTWSHAAFVASVERYLGNG